MTTRTNPAVKIILALLLLFVLSSMCHKAQAWDCKPGVNTEPCVLNPTPGGTTNTNTNDNSNSQKQGQQQQQTQSQDQSQEQSNNTGNSQTTNFSSNYQRSAPSIGLGGIGIIGCAGAINGGGSNSHGAALFGIAWTPYDCYMFYLAQGYLSIGQVAAACEVLNRTHAAEKLARNEGMPLPKCGPPPAPPVVSPPAAPVLITPGAPPACADCVTREELDEKIRRAKINELSK